MMTPELQCLVARDLESVAAAMRDAPDPPRGLAEAEETQWLIEQIERARERQGISLTGSRPGKKKRKKPSSDRAS